MEPGNNKSAFKLKSGNKPSMAKLAGVSPMKDKVIGSHTAKFTQKKKGFDFTGTGNFKFPKDYDMKKYSDYTKYDDDRD